MWQTKGNSLNSRKTAVGEKHGKTKRGVSKFNPSPHTHTLNPLCLCYPLLIMQRRLCINLIVHPWLQDNPSTLPPTHTHTLNLRCRCNPLQIMQRRLCINLLVPPCLHDFSEPTYKIDKFGISTVNRTYLSSF